LSGIQEKRGESHDHRPSPRFDFAIFSTFAEKSLQPR
jgi:hypothetical protein